MNKLFTHLVLLIVSYHACLGVALKRVPKPRHLQRMKHSSRWNNSCTSFQDSDLLGDVSEYATVSFAKAGTELMWGLTELVAKYVHMPVQHCLPSQENNVCAPGTVTHYNGCDKNYRTAQLAKCPRIRGMHLVRRPMSMLVSDFLYTKFGDLQGNFEITRERWRKALNKLNNRQGLQYMCGHTTYRTSVMVESFEAIINNTNFLQLKLEDFAEDFDATTRSIWAHFGGTDPLEAADFMQQASYYDFKRNPMLKEAGKFADAKLAEEAMHELEYLPKDNCINHLKDLDRRLGYTTEEHLFLNLPETLA